MTEQIEHRPSEIQPGDVIRYRLRSYLGPATVRYSDPIRVVRVLDAGPDAVVVAADHPSPCRAAARTCCHPKPAC